MLLTSKFGAKHTCQLGSNISMGISCGITEEFWYKRNFSNKPPLQLHASL